MVTGRSSPSALSRTALRERDGARRAVQRRVAPMSPVVQALADVHGGVGNDVVAGVFSAEATLGALPAHTLGGLALSMAGVDTGGVAPGTAPLSAMRAAMRHAQAGTQAEAEGLDTATAAGRIGKRGGQPLPEPVRERMERAFGHDFRHVRIHTDGGAAAAADALHAVAFAVGNDLYFAPGAFRPGTPAGDTLLAHELTHVVQADEGRLPKAGAGGLDVSRPTDPHEREADAWSRLVTRALGSGQADAVSEDAAEWSAADAALAEGPDPGVAGVTDAPGVAQAPVGPETAPAAEQTATEAAPLASRQANPGGSSPAPANATGRDLAEQKTVRLMLAGEPIEATTTLTEGEGEEVEFGLDQEIEQGEAAGLHLRRARLRLDRDGDIIGGELDAEREGGEAMTLDVHIGGEVVLESARRVADIPTHE